MLYYDDYLFAAYYSWGCSIGSTSWRSFEQSGSAFAAPVCFFVDIFCFLTLSADNIFFFIFSRLLVVLAFRNKQVPSPCFVIIYIYIIIAGKFLRLIMWHLQVLVRKFLELHDKYMAYVNDCFMNHTLFHKVCRDNWRITYWIIEWFIVNK